MQDLTMIQKKFHKELIRWYLKNKRELPWRETTDPYPIWLSEIILQQTRVQQGMPYYFAFLKQFPTVFDLAHASEKDVLSLWQGLGYYSRARNLHKTAQQIVSEFKGIFPDSYIGLLELKGVGPYTAAAIASFAYKESVAVVDGNVYRVLTRIFGIYEDITLPATKKQIAILAQSLIPTKQADIYNQAIMEFGAIHCTPAEPNCENCPFSGTCVAYSTGDQKILPIKAKAKAKESRFFNYVIIRSGDIVLMKERGANDIWQGLYEFWLHETAQTVLLAELQLDQFHLTEKYLRAEYGPFKHILSHQILHAQFYVFDVPQRIFMSIKKQYSMEEINISEITLTPKPVLIAKCLKAHKF
jgi:A/G-specific adenine glycosylase